MNSIESILGMILTEAIEETARLRIELGEKEIGPELPPIVWNEPVLTEEDCAYLRKRREAYTKP